MKAESEAEQIKKLEQTVANLGSRIRKLRKALRSCEAKNRELAQRVGDSNSKRE